MRQLSYRMGASRLVCWLNDVPYVVVQISEHLPRSRSAPIRLSIKLPEFEVEVSEVSMGKARWMMTVMDY